MPGASMLEPGIGIICAVEDGAGGFDVTNSLVEDMTPTPSHQVRFLASSASGLFPKPTNLYQTPSTST
jgi:hypothetical protein